MAYRSTFSLLPVYYLYDLHSTRHLFMSLNRWISGRLQPMHSQGSYLAAHQPSFAISKPLMCVRYDKLDETFKHAVLHCSSRAATRPRFLSDLGSFDPIWHSITRLNDIATNIRATQTEYLRPISHWPHSLWLDPRLLSLRSALALHETVLPFVTLKPTGH